MNQPDLISAAFIRNGAAGLAGFAATELLESHAHLKTALAHGPFATWQHLLRSCLEELAASLAAARPQFFTDYVSWVQRLLTARGLPADAVPTALHALARVLEAELPSPSAAHAVEACRDVIRALDGPLPDPPGFLPADTPHGRLAASYLLALLEGDRARAGQLIMDAADDGTPVPELYLHVLMPAQQEIGRMWQTDEVNVAEEHFATSTTKSVLAQLRSRVPLPPPRGRTVLAASVVGNHHDLGLQVVADFFEMDGWRVIHLGSNMPIPDLCQAVEFYRPDLLALSVALHTQLVTLTATIQAVRGGQHGASVKILVGGQALAETPELAASLGADAYAANASDAVAQGNSLVHGD